MLGVQPVSGDGDLSVLERLGDLGLVPVVVIDSPDRAEPLGEALVAGGLPCAEVTFRTPAAAAVIERLTRTYPDMLVGAGTILTVEQAQAAVAAGGSFVVSPGFDEAVVDWCLAHEVPVVPGVMTPSEITRAVNMGLDVVKFFPAEPAGGVRALQAFGGVFPNVRFMPTGGIGAANLADYLQLPMVAACGGSWVAPGPLIAKGDFGEITRRTRDAVAIVRGVREVD
jgi:2-dehydro-3-deoxyphosphogluconate aldolase/(4S)-4-hydroxy-2-oxoglutarate aldolase